MERLVGYLEAFFFYIKKGMLINVLEYSSVSLLKILNFINYIDVNIILYVCS